MKAFNPRGEGSSGIEADGRPGRRATKWLSYDIPLQTADPIAVVLTTTATRGGRGSSRCS